MTETRIDTAQLGFLAWLMYPIAAMFFFFAPLDVVIGLWPWQPGVVRWRVGAVGLVSGATLLPVLGIFLSLAAAHLLGHRKMQYVLAGLCLVGAVIFAGMLLLFALDVLQLRGRVAQEGLRQYDVAAVKGILTQMMLVAVLVFMGWSSLRRSLALRKKDRSGGGHKQVLVTQMSGT